MIMMNQILKTTTSRMMKMEKRQRCLQTQLEVPEDLKAIIMTKAGKSKTTFRTLNLKST